MIARMVQFGSLRTIGVTKNFLPVFVSLTKGQQNQPVMVNALLSVVVYFV